MPKTTAKRESVYLIPWNDDPDAAMRLASSRCQGANLVLLEKRIFREGKTLEQLRRFRTLSGRAVILFFKSLADINVPLLLPWLTIVHRCKRTILMDETGASKVYSRNSLMRLFPQTVVALICDLTTLVFSRIQLRFLRTAPPPATKDGMERDFDFLYLFPGMGTRSQVGGAMSHVQGILSGLKEEGAKCVIFSAQPLPSGGYSTIEIPLPRRLFFFWEARALHFNFHVSKFIGERMRQKSVAAVYQRHARFTIAGVLLARSMRVPLFLEYNGSESWIARHWDPSRFRSWLDQCEQIALQHASLISVVSRALYDELLGKGVAKERIVILPNAVDATMFRPDCGGSEVRRKLGISRDDLVLAFVGTFSYWHGITVMQEAIQEILAEPDDLKARKMRFLLIGEGPLRAEIATDLAEHVRDGRVIFTGTVAHEEVPAYLDCADILLSPHCRMPDGRPFFGSPTKLFEYMAMGKAIIASNLDQIGQVLQHELTALLVEPGSFKDLCEAIRRLRDDEALRRQLGNEARQVVCADFTWKHNARTLLDLVRAGGRLTEPTREFPRSFEGSVATAREPREH